ncbi:sugar transferase [Pleionea sp. CnH1-48]|uniref:sugar transferase n=1 Tax=Pleionea sp. CnH1-48 TaxID=2954494 RepID=UPI0020977D19|nr:sugar transferase [Pleionea sp. CnH1-48]MCO7223786.1 sugar transferase [Pleionea sp. CnH1-48]
MYAQIVKPFSDKVMAFILLILLFPFMLAVSVGLAISLSSNPFFLQKRGGYKNRVFKIIKFKTMTNERDSSGELLPDSERLTKFGAVVRSLSLDELPQLFNILKGDMSFVGPRPFLSDYLDIYTDEERQRHNVKPGITGWAQVNGRNTLTWKQKFKLDLWYVENQSLLIDIKIVLLTIVKVVRRESVNQSSTETMEKYDGTN